MSIINVGCRKGFFLATVAIVTSVISSCGVRGVDDYEIRSTDSVYAYRTGSPYAAVLKECVLVNTVEASCPIAKLPFIGDGTNTPTVDQVMDRVLVTHDWMGARFEEVLRTAPDTLLTLFSSSTSILIGSDVRPSFYTVLNGGIQLDPAYLWSTVAEKGSISKEEDFRAGFGNELQFWFLSRLADANGERIAPYYSIDDDSERPVEDLRIPLLRLLFHELVHATDFMPRENIAGLDNSLSVFNAIDGIREDWLSNKLVASNPLTSVAMDNMAQVRFRGVDASADQKATSAAEVGELMATDGAIHFYSYTSQHEDLAQLVEGAMMGFHYGSISNIGFTQKPIDEDNYGCSDLLMAWGQRNRLADSLVNVRSRVATELAMDMTPELAAFIDSKQGNAEAMSNNVDWCNNQTPSNIVASDTQIRSAAPNRAIESGPQFREMIRADSVVHHDGVNHD